MSSSFNPSLDPSISQLSQSINWEDANILNTVTVCPGNQSLQTTHPSSSSSSSSSNASKSSSLSAIVKENENPNVDVHAIFNQISPLPPFIKGVENLLVTLMGFFVECEKTPLVLYGYRSEYMHNPENSEWLIFEWHNKMKQYYDSCKSTQLSEASKILEADIKIFQSLDIHAKWNHPDLDDDGRRGILSHIVALNEHAMLYCAFFKKFINNINKVAEQINADQANGIEYTEQEIKERCLSEFTNLNDDDLEFLSKNISAFIKLLGPLIGQMDTNGDENMLGEMNPFLSMLNAPN